MSSIETKLDDIYDKLVHVRDKMAKKMGYDNYIPFGYIRLGRSDYDASMVKNYRDQVYETIVPIAKSIIENQKSVLAYQILNPMIFLYFIMTEILCLIRIRIP